MSERPLSIRWWLLGLIGLAGGGLLYAVQVNGLSVIRPSRDFTIIVGLINLAVYVWARAWSRLRPAIQFVAIALLVIVQATLLSILRLDGFAGDGRIVFKWRWTSTPEERMGDYSSHPQGPSSLANFTDPSDTDSPSFRGADRTGQYRNPELDLNWDVRQPKELWRHPVGRGWSSFAVVGEFCVTQEQRDAGEAVVCYRLGTGEEVWMHLDANSRFEEVTSGPGPRATPTIHEGHVYTFGATGILNCLDGANGQVVWSRQIAKGSAPILFGYASSPLIYGQNVFVTAGGQAGSIVAVDRETGEIAWTKGSSKAVYCSPQLFVTGREAQILVFDATGLAGHDAVTGDTRWKFPWGDNSDERVNVCQPAMIESTGKDRQGVQTNQLLISSGYGRGSALISVTCNSLDEWIPNEVWRANTLKSKFSSIVVHGGHVFGLDDGILTCISLVDGTRRWKQGRYGHGQLIIINDMLLVQAESGRIVLVNADSKAFREVSMLDALSERTWNHPVLAGRHFLVRNDREAVCYLLPVLEQHSRLDLK